MVGSRTISPPVPAAVPRRARGFTLLEIVTCVAIVAVLASMVQLSAADGSQQAVDLAVVQVQDALDRARTLSRSKRVPHGVAFDLVQDRFVVVDAEGEPATDPLTRGAYFVDFIRPGQPQRIDLRAADFGSAGLSALFDAQGVPLSGGSVVLSCGPIWRRLVLDPATGGITIL